jgi:hypothetical protein
VAPVNSAASEARRPAAFLWILILGAAGFLAGFVGPMIVAPDANQGPLVGIFISGPGGVILGVILLAISRGLRIAPPRQWQILLGAAALLAVVTIVCVMPSPQLLGYIVDARIDACSTPAESTDRAIQYWEKRMAPYPSTPPRTGWKEEARANLRDDSGVVIETAVTRRKRVYEGRKLWNKGRILARGWYDVNQQKKFYARPASGSCAEYPAGTRVVDFIEYDNSVKAFSAEDWPPREIPDFLDLQTIAPVPEEYRQFVGN